MAAPGSGSYDNPKRLYDFLERHPVGPDYIKRTAGWLAEKYPTSWPAMRPRIAQIYRAEVKRAKPRK